MLEKVQSVHQDDDGAAGDEEDDEQEEDEPKRGAPNDDVTGSLVARTFFF